MTIDDIFSRLPGALNTQAASGVDATILFNTSQPRNVVIKDSALIVNEGTVAPYTVAITMADDDLVKMLTGELDGMTAFMTGKLKIDGDLMFAQSITSLFDGSKLRD